MTGDKYIVVQVSPQRWVVAEQMYLPDLGDYLVVTKPLVSHERAHQVRRILMTVPDVGSLPVDVRNVLRDRSSK